MQNEESNVTIHLGETPVSISRQHARELYGELEALYESGNLYEPVPEIYTVPTEMEFRLRQMMEKSSAEMGKQMFDSFIKQDPFNELLLHEHATFTVKGRE